MVRHRSVCQTDRLKVLLNGGLARDEEFELDAHLGECAACRDALEALAAGRSWWADLPRLGEHDPEHDAADFEADGDRGLEFLEPSESPGSLGRLGPYEVQGVLGRGGMGVVLRAFDPTLHRPVAIKVIAPQLATSAAARRRFAREARAAAAVSHDHIVAIHAVAESASGLPYLVMPYIPGQSLQERLDRTGPLGVAEILRIGMQAASALAAAHAQGLVHRDVKPANILLENGVERVKITDFGLARVADDAHLSQSGFIAGTPQYMAPEQANGEPVDHRADLFSLGSVLYAMATGQSPFRASTNVAVLRRVCENQPKPIRTINPEIPTWLVAIIAKLHAKDPAERFGSAEEVAGLLGHCLAYLERPDGPPPFPVRREPGWTRRRARWGLVGALAIVLTALGAAEAGGLNTVRSLLAAVLRIKTPEGTLVIEVNDPEIEIRVDDQNLVIAGAGPQEIRLGIGTHRLFATKQGKLVREDLVTITKDRNVTVAIHLEPNEPEGHAAAVPAPPRSVVIAPKNATPAPPLEPGGEVAILPAPARSVIIVPENYAPGPQRQALPQFPEVVSGPQIPGARPSDLLRPVPLSDHSPAPLWPGDAITFAAYSRDGKFLALASNGSTPDANGKYSGFKVKDLPANRLGRQILLYELPTYRLVATLTGHSARVMELVFSPDGTKIAAATGHWGFSAKSGEVWLWDLTKLGSSGRPIVVGIPMVFSVAFSPDGTTLAYAGWDDVIALYSMGSDTVRAVCRGHEQKIHSVAFSPDGKLLASGSSDKSVRLWDAQTGEPVGDPFPRFRCGIPSVAFSPDGTLLAAHSSHWADPPVDLSAFPQIKVWDVSTRRERAVLSGHPNHLSRIAFAPDGKTLASAGGVDNKSGEVILWDVATWKPRATLREFPSTVECVAFAPDARTLLATTTHTGNRSEIRVWDLAPPAGPQLKSAVEPTVEPVFERDIASGRVWSVAFAPGGKKLAAGVGNRISHGRLCLWDLAAGTVRISQRPRLGIRAVAYAPDGKRLAFGTFDGSLVVCDAEGSGKRVLEGHTVSINALAFAPDGTLLASAAQDGTARLWDVESGRELHRFASDDDEVWSLAFSPDGKTLAIGFKSGLIKLLDVASGVKRRQLGGHTLGVGGMAYTPDGSKLVSGGGDRTVRLWDPASGECLAKLEGHERAVTSVAVAPDGRSAASGDGAEDDMKAPAGLIVWDLATPGLRARFAGHHGRIWSVAFSPDGKTLASAGEDGEVKLWNPTGQSGLSGGSLQVP